MEDFSPELKKQKLTKQAALQIKMQQSFDFKVNYAEIRINEFITEMGKLDKNCAVSVGGLDSIVLYCFIKQFYSDIPGISVSAIEDKTVRAIHRQLKIIDIKPTKSKYEILTRIGYPIISKDIARKISVVQNPTPRNQGYLNAILNGITTDGRQTTVTKLPEMYYNMFFKKRCKVPISDKCCLYMKEKPIADWLKNNNSVPFLGLHADESHRRFLALSKNGCNYISGDTSRSAPFAIFTKSDILQLALKINAPIPEIYGEIKQAENGEYYTTGAARTGCDICGFGLQFEKTRPHRFDILYQENPHKWEFYINRLRYGELFEHIGFEYKQPFTPGDLAWK